MELGDGRQYACGRDRQVRRGTTSGGYAPFCPTSCPALGPNGRTIAVGNAKLACPVEDEKIRLAMLASDGTEDKAKE